MRVYLAAMSEASVFLTPCVSRCPWEESLSFKWCVYGLLSMYPYLPCSQSFCRWLHHWFCLEENYLHTPFPHRPHLVQQGESSPHLQNCPIITATFSPAPLTPLLFSMCFSSETAGMGIGQRKTDKRRREKTNAREEDWMKELHGENRERMLCPSLWGIPFFRLSRIEQ